MSRLALRSDDAALQEALAQVVGTSHVSSDSGLFDHDIYAKAPFPPALIAAPADAAQTAAILRIAAGWDRAVVTRGAGMSYTGGYLPAEAGAILLDMRRMNRIRAIDAESMTVTVEAGATWSALHAALRGKGLRTPFYGPLSGLVSTIGGGLSQHNAFLGAGMHGPSADSVVALKVALADGTIVETGARRASGAPFFRHYGPDLAGLFLGDCGALGVKLEATLRLMPAPAHEEAASFAFAARDGAAAALSGISRAGIGAEVFGFDPALMRVRMKRASLGKDLKALADVARSGRSLIGGVVDAAKIAAAGRGFVGEHDYTVHIVAEGRSAAAVGADLDAARRLAREAGGREIEATIPRVMRANPFPPLDSVVGPDGERWAPVHGIVSHADARAAWAAIEGRLAAFAPRFAEAGVSSGCLLTTLSSNGFLIEPVFYWPGALEALHMATVDPALLARMKPCAHDARAAELVAEARAGMIETFAQFGAAHFQIGRTYPYRRGIDAGAVRLLEAAKAALDPQGRLNPGALGLGDEGGMTR